MERDEESGLTYHRKRCLLPWLARWASTDPTDLAGGINRFQYAESNPLQYSDPTGEQAVGSLLKHEEGEFWKAYRNQNLPWLTRQLAGDFAQATGILGKAWGLFDRASFGAIGRLDAIHDKQAAGAKRYSGEYGTANYVSDVTLEVGIFAAKAVVSLASGPIASRLAPAAPAGASLFTRAAVVGGQAAIRGAITKFGTKGVDVAAGRGNLQAVATTQAVVEESVWETAVASLAETEPYQAPTVDSNIDDTGPADAKYVHDQYAKFVRGGELNPKRIEGSLGLREYDDYEEIGEVKTGFEANTTPWDEVTQEQFDRKLEQIGKDFANLREGLIHEVIWFGTHRFPDTGLGAELKAALDQAGILYWHVPWMM